MASVTEGLILSPSFKSMHLQYPVAKSLRIGFQSEQLFDCSELLMVSDCTYFKAGDFLHNWPPPLLVPTDALMHLAGAFVVEMKACPWPCSDAMAAMKGGDRLRGRGGRRRCRYMLWLLGTLSQLAAWSSTAGNN